MERLERVFLVPHFHFDAVFWNTQAAYTETWELSGLPWEDPFQRPGLALLRDHLDRADADARYAFVAGEIDCLAPYWESFPEDRARIRRLLAEGRLELVGGAYNQPDTNLSLPETVARVFETGAAYHRDVIGGEPRTGWQLDVFGHSPSTPALAAAVGLESVVYARGPHHAWGPWWYKHPDLSLDPPPAGDAAMQTPTEYEWIAPDGSSVLACYLPWHYHAGWWIERSATVEEAAAELERLVRAQAPYAATPNVLVPVGTDFTPASRWVCDLVEHWNARRERPRLCCSTAAEFVRAVRASGVPLVPQSRDLNPVFAGTLTSAAGAKLAHRAAEVAVTTAETAATVAALLGTPLAADALARAWRLLAFAAHHDAVTGSHSDTVQLDLLAGWREALELAEEVRDAALDAVAARVDTRGEGEPLAVFNPSSWPRSDLVRCAARFAPGAAAGIELRDGDGGRIPLVADGVTAHPDGSLDRVEVAFVARDVPAAGHRLYRLVATSAPLSPDALWAQRERGAIASDAFAIAADPETGALTSLRDLAGGRELLRPGALADELVAYGQHADHPRFGGEGLWHICSDGSAASAAAAPADVRREVCAVGERLVVSGPFAGGERRQVTTLWRGLGRVELDTALHGVAPDLLVRTRFGFDAPGALPLCDAGGAVVARGFARLGADARDVPAGPELPAQTWAGLGTAVTITSGGAPVRALGAVEIVTDDPAAARPLVTALVAKGVTASVTRPDGPRHGAPALDTSLPDARIAIGDNTFARAVLAAAGADRAKRAWVPARVALAALVATGADRRGTHDLPVLVLAAAEVGRVVAELEGRTIEVPGAAPGMDPAPRAGVGVALLNRGTPGWAAEPDGTLSLALLDTTRNWPHGLWPDPAPRPVLTTGEELDPFAGSHRVAYALVAGDWRAARVQVRAREYLTPLIARRANIHDGPLDPVWGAVTVKPDHVALDALRPDRGGVALRLAELDGRPASATVRLLLGTGAADVPPSGRATLVLPADIPVAPPAPPEFARHWLHDAGPAPERAATVRVERLTTPPTERAAYELGVLVSATAAAAGVVRVQTPDGWRAEPSVLPYAVAGDAPLRATVALSPPPDAAPGRYFVAARLDDQEDVVALDVGPVAPGPELDVDVVTDALQLAPGDEAELLFRLRNRTRAPIRGVAQLVSPYGTWRMLAPRARPFAVAAGARQELAFAVAVPPTHPEGDWWALVKLAWYGRRLYSDAVPIACRRDRRLRADRPKIVQAASGSRP